MFALRTNATPVPRPCPETGTSLETVAEPSPLNVADGVAVPLAGVTVAVILLASSCFSAIATLSALARSLSCTLLLPATPSYVPVHCAVVALTEQEDVRMLPPVAVTVGVLPVFQATNEVLQRVSVAGVQAAE